ncbi:metalloregulator ArsR/SmtB family transcription factor [Paenibacillus radicis (ex Xue et al. 2023)]|uniref:Metalloregulator ArsR/SmtB family transcription factor n=1 Tax=Paenibacillus radicis (ex Xue et al. 2023) TaxID=2972489 RepID=A0ABT1YBX3_9BACL|nr:metalloregulator ArsR/SmtB family transcription factor [Paenibacillus radicis (ex Xue et al. 2023)]MCR8630260.1 metalloregulator ArsR/SmtB family transcription factor [Paenibacillus radicis (ex Xue et al. 2023)]
MDVPNGRPFKDAIYKQFARIGKCLSSERRLELLDLLSQGEKSVEKLAQQTNMTIANVSQHLQVLSEACLVTSRKKGTFVYYELANTAVNELLLSLWRAGEHQLSDVQRIKEQFLNPRDSFHKVTLDEVLSRQKLGEIILIDVRPIEEYEYDHVPGALSIPMNELVEQMNKQSSNLDIVVYCRGPYCAYAAQAVEELRNKGFQAYRLEEGINEWKQHMKSLRFSDERIMR